MSEVTAAALLVLFVVIVAAVLKSIPRTIGAQCGKCSRAVPKGKVMYPECGAPVTAPDRT
jgi:hypothetical protein